MVGVKARLDRRKIILSLVLIIFAAALLHTASAVSTRTITVPLDFDPSAPATSFDKWIVPTGATYTKIAAVTDSPIDDSKYIISTVNNDHQTFVLKANQIPSDVVVNSLNLVVYAKKPGTQVTKFSITVAKGTTLSDAPNGGNQLTSSYTSTTSPPPWSRLMTTNPTTNAKWTASEINTGKTTDGSKLSYGISQNTDAKEDRVTKITAEASITGTPSITITSPSAPVSMPWGTLTISGTTTFDFSTDTVTVNWGDSSTTTATRTGHTWTASHAYLHAGSYNIQATLSDGTTSWATSALFPVTMTKHATSVSTPTLDSTTVFWGQTFKVTSTTLTDTSTGTGLAGTLTYTGTAVVPTPSGTTGATGSLTGPVTVTSVGAVGTGKTVIANFTGNSDYLGSISAPATIEIKKHTTALTIGDIPNTFWGQAISESGTLTDTVLSSGINSASITFTGSGVGTLAAATTAGGAYTSSGNAPGAPAATGLAVVANYAGDSAYAPATSPTDNYDTLVHTTALTIGDIPNTFWGQAISESGTLTDTVLSSGINSASITFTGSGVGTLAAATTAGGAYTSSGNAPSTVATGLQVTANYAGDPTAYTPSTSTTDNYDTLIHTTSLSLKTIESIPVGNKFTIIGNLVDASVSGGIPNKAISFSGTGVTSDLPSATTTSASITDASTMIISPCSPCPTPVNILHIHAGTIISTPSNPTFVQIFITDMGSNSVTVVGTTGDGSTLPSTTKFADGDNTVLVSVSDPSGVNSVQITAVSGGGLAGISKIQTLNSQLAVLIDTNFNTYTSQTASSLTIGGGAFSSTGTSQSTVQPDLGVTATFGGDSLYTTSSGSGIYSTVPTTITSTGGIGGTEAVTADSGKVYSVTVACGSDSDGDALCDSWEGGTGTGIPFTVSGTLYKYPLGSNSTVKDIFAEVDSFTGHAPLPNSLTAVATAFANHGITVHFDTTESSLADTPVINVWKDLDTNRANDFDSIKADHFGNPSEYATLGLSSLSYLVDGSATLPSALAGTHTLTVRGLSISIPTNSITSGATEGSITIQAQVTTTNSLDAALATAVSVPASISAPASPAGLTLGPTITVTSSSTSKTNVKLITLSVPFTTTGPIGATALPDITVTLTPGASAKISAVATNPLSPSFTTTLLNAKSQAYRYILFADSMGGQSGQAELRGNDAVIALGVGFTGTTGSRNEQAGTLMHEMGHLLNLQHGGPQYLQSDVSQLPIAENTINCKPNYESVMSYSRQIPTYMSSHWVLDYSNNLLPALTENALTEVSGNLKSSTNVRPWFVWGSPGAVTGPAHVQQANSSSQVAGNVDWTGNGAYDPGTGTISSRISNFGISLCQETAAQTTAYHDANDWSNLDFNFRQGPIGYVDGVHEQQQAECDINCIHQSKIANAQYFGPIPPPNPNGTEEREEGSTLPLKFKVFDTDGAIIDFATAVARYTTNGITFTPITCKNSADGNFLFVASGNFYQCDWKTPHVEGKYGIDYVLKNPGAIPDEKILFDPKNTLKIGPTQVTITVKLEED